MGIWGDVELDAIELSGPRLTLRRWRPEDAARVLEVMQDPSMYEFLALPRPYTAEVAHRFVTDLGHEGRGTGTGVGCAVVERDGGRLVGAAALRLGDEPDIGYWIAPDARGRGYAAEATRALTAFGLAHGLPRVELRCEVTNLASARTALAAGFRFEGVARDAGARRDGERARPPADLAVFSRLPGDPDSPVRPAFAPLPAGGLRDGVITVRVLAASDAAEFAETDDPTTRAAGFGGPDRTPRDYAQVTAHAGLNWLVGGQGMTAIVDDATGALAGSVTLRQSGPPQVGGIGYVVHPLFRGRGYTARALRLLVPWAFAAGFTRLELGAKADNIASQRAALAAGFAPDGVRAQRLRRVDGTFADEVRFVLLNPAHRVT